MENAPVTKAPIYGPNSIRPNIKADPTKGGPDLVPNPDEPPGATFTGAKGLPKPGSGKIRY